MKKTRLSVLISFLAIILLFSSCAKRDPYIDDENEDEQLQLYLMYYSDHQKKAIYKYNQEVSEGNIDSRIIQITEFESEDREAMFDRISREMISGEGPDVIFFGDITDYYLDLTKMTGQDAFADMDILIEKSSTFSFDDYNKDALDAGIINGKRVMMPLSFQVSYIVTTNENLDIIDMQVPDYLTFGDYIEIMERSHNNTDSIGSLFPFNRLLYDMISEEGLDDKGLYELEKCINFEIEEDKRYSALVNTGIGMAGLYRSMYDGNIITYYSGYGGGNMGEFDVLTNEYNVIENMYDSTFVLLNEPNIHPDSQYGYIDSGCVINMNSRYKNDAFKFVEFMLSEQCQFGDTLRASSFPVNNASYESAKNDFINDISTYEFSYTMSQLSLTPLPDEVKDRFINLVEGVTEYKYIGQQRYIIRNVIRDSLNEYKNGEIDFSTMTDEINRKIKLYFSE